MAWARRRYRHPLRGSSRRGLTLMEVMVAIALLMALLLVMVPAVSSMFSLNQRKAAKDLVLMYQRLHDEALLHNVTFRVIYLMNEDEYQIEMGKPGALIFDNPEDRERYEEEMAGKLALMDEEERKAFLRTQAPFEKINAKFESKFKLPAGVAFGGVYTPQYHEMVVPNGDDGEEAHEKQRVFSHVFSHGHSEHTVIWIVSKKDPDDGFTVEIEPLSGEIRMHGELIDWEDSYDFVPEEGPELPT